MRGATNMVRAEHLRRLMLFTVLLAGLALYYVTLLGIFFKKRF